MKYKGNIKDWAQTGLESKSKQVVQTPSTATLSVLLSLSQLSPTASGKVLYTPKTEEENPQARHDGATKSGQLQPNGSVQARH